MSRPHLEFAISVWNPYRYKDADKLERIQRKATKLVPVLRKKPYNFRLSQLELTTLEIRRQRGDLIQFYKILNKLDQVKWLKDPEQVMQNDELGPAQNLRREGGVRFHRGPGKIRTERDEYFLSRVIPLWNQLPKKAKEARSLNSFKAELDRWDTFIV